MNLETHLFLSTPGADVEHLVAHLAREGFPADEPVFVVGPAPLAETFAEGPWTWLPLEEADPPSPAPNGHVLLIAPPGADPRPLLENLRAWLEEHQRELGRIFTLIDCLRLSQSSALQPYYDCCIHFSDVILLTGRADVSKKWIQDYQNQLKKRAIPATLTLVKKGHRVDDLPALLFPEARRLSQFFDPPETDALIGLEIEGFGDGEDEEIDPRDAEQDPYLEHYEDGTYVFQLKPVV